MHPKNVLLQVSLGAEGLAAQLAVEDPVRCRSDGSFVVHHLLLVVPLPPPGCVLLLLLLRLEPVLTVLVHLQRRVGVEVLVAEAAAVGADAQVTAQVLHEVAHVAEGGRAHAALQARARVGGAGLVGVLQTRKEQK